MNTRMTLTTLLWLASLAMPLSAGETPPEGCPPPGHDRAELEQLRERAFAVPEDARHELAIALLSCVGDPDPAMRDGIVYAGLSRWLRGGELPEITRREIYDDLLEQLNRPDSEGFRRPFAALLLGEVARTDRIEPWLTGGERHRLVAAATEYLQSVSDYRGYSDAEGWRHGVAHGADFVLQLVLNPEVDGNSLQRLLDAIAAQVAPAGAVFYIFGEPQRLARPVLFAFRRGLIDDEWWARWFERVAAPGPFPGWAATWSSEAGLARRHNVQAFLSALYVGATLGHDAADPRLVDWLTRSIAAVSDS